MSYDDAGSFTDELAKVGSVFTTFTEDVSAALSGRRENHLRQQIARAESDQRKLSTRIDRLNAEVDRIAALRERIPREDPFENGDVLLIQRSPARNGSVYSYAALRVVGRWWITGVATPQNMNWFRFLEWLLAGDVREVTKLCRDMSHREQFL